MQSIKFVEHYKSYNVRPRATKFGKKNRHCRNLGQVLNSLISITNFVRFPKLPSIVDALQKIKQPLKPDKKRQWDMFSKSLKSNRRSTAIPFLTSPAARLVRHLALGFWRKFISLTQNKKQLFEIRGKWNILLKIRRRQTVSSSIGFWFS